MNINRDMYEYTMYSVHGTVQYGIVYMVLYTVQYGIVYNANALYSKYSKYNVPSSARRCFR